MNDWLSRQVAGTEKLWIGILAVAQTYITQVEWLSEPEKSAVIGLLGVAQVWLGTNNSPTAPTQEN